MGQPSPYLQRALALLADGSWHNQETVLREMIKLIPPGQCLRRAERNRTLQFDGRPLTPRRITRSTEYLRLTGGRAIAVDSLKQAPALERKKDANGTWIRLRRPPTTWPA